MRSPSHPPLTGRHTRNLVERAARDSSAAEALLGVYHPFVALLRRYQIVVERMFTVGVVQLVAGILLYRGTSSAPPLAIATILVQIALAWRLFTLLQARRELCLQLIIGGSSRLPLAAVELESRQLQDPAHLAYLARWLEEVVDVAARNGARVHSARAVFSVRVVRAVVPDLLAVAALLRTDSPPICGVALVEQLVTSGLSPLYGTDVEPLRRELGRARYLLTS